MAQQTNPPHEPDALSYKSMATAVIEETFGAQAAMARSGGADAVRPDVLAAVSTSTSTTVRTST